jgi:hypothetical protein
MPSIHSMGREARPAYIPLLRYSAEDALEHCATDEGTVHRLRDGRVEVWGGKSGSEAIGWMSRRSLEIFIERGGKVS